MDFRGGLLRLTDDLASADVETAALVATQEQRVDSLLGQRIGTLHEDWVRAFSGESNIGNWLTAQVRQQLKTDIALWNSGGIRKDLVAGPITMRDAWEIAPFGNEMLIVELSGAEILQTYRAISRGEFEFVQFDGMRARFNEEHELQGFDLPTGPMRARTGCIASLFPITSGARLRPSPGCSIAATQRSTLVVLTASL